MFAICTTNTHKSEPIHAASAFLATLEACNAHQYLFAKAERFQQRRKRCKSESESAVESAVNTVGFNQNTLFYAVESRIICYPDKSFILSEAKLL